MTAENCETHFSACGCIEARRSDYIFLVKKEITAQASDDGIWFEAETVTEDYLQCALRALTRIVEDWLDWEDGHDE